MVLVPPRCRHVTWRARFVDLETGRTKAVRLDPMALRTAEARRQWAIALALTDRTIRVAPGESIALGLLLTECHGVKKTRGNLELLRQPRHAWVVARRSCNWARQGGRHFCP